MKKTLLFLLAGIGMMFATPASSQVNEEMLDMVVATWPSLGIDPQNLEEVRTALISNNWKDQAKVLDRYMVVQKVGFREVKFLHPTNLDATQISRITARDTVVELMSIKLDELTGNPSMKGQTLPLMSFSSQGVTHPFFIIGFELSDEEAPVVAQQRSNQEPSGEELVQSTTNVESSSITTLPNGTVIGPGFYSLADGTTFVRQGDGTYVELKAKSKSRKELAQQEAQRQAIADTALRTASYQMTVAQRGDPALLASAGTQQTAQQQQQGAAGSGVGVERYQIDGKWYYDHPVTGIPTPIQGQPKVVTLKSNQVLLDGDGDLAMQERKREKQKVHRLYDLETNAPTSGSARAVEARSDWVTGGRGTTVVVGGGYYPYGAVYQPVVKKYHGFQYTRKKCW